jgi:hypothetical protein
MTTQDELTTQPSGEYLVMTQRSGQGIDYYLQVVGPDGRASEQKVYWLYSMTPHQVAEEAVAGHVGRRDAQRAAATRQSPDGGYIVTLA